MTPHDAVHDAVQQAIEELEAASSAFASGDPAPFSALWSHTEDITIMGAWGAYEKGWEQVGPRMDWAAGRFREGRVSYEPLAMGMSGDLAYAVGIERGEARVIGSDVASPIALRVTHIFRREQGAWKLVHRHADAIVDKTAAAAIVQQ